jgi:hypothetical protein
MRILVFLHGTTIMHPGAVGRTREERVVQARSGEDPTLADYDAYVPIGSAASKLRAWQERGARIEYLSSRFDPASDIAVLRRHGFPEGRVFVRGEGESYGDVVERASPDVLIEDDCESIGAAHIAHGQLRPERRAATRSIIVPEFGGVDHLPDSPPDLLSFAS